jgi:hypothetical protein
VHGPRGERDKRYAMMGTIIDKYCSREEIMGQEENTDG